MKDPLVPIIEMEYSPAVELEHVRIAVPGEGGMVRLFGLGEQLTAAGAEALRLTVPLPPFMGLTVMANVAVDPIFPVWVAGLAEILKSVGSMTVKVAVAVWDSVPLAPITDRT